MNIPVYQSLSLAANAAAFGVLDYSEKLNTLASRITGGRVDRNTMAEGVLHQATHLAMDIARQKKSVENIAQKHFEITGGELMSHVDRILFSQDNDVFLNSVDDLLAHTLHKQIENGNLTKDDAKTAHDLARNLINDRIGRQAIHQVLGSYAKHHDWQQLTARIQEAAVGNNGISLKSLLITAGVRAASGFVHRLVQQGVSENPSFAQLEVKPEMRLAADCLHAYLTNDFNCAEALENYQSENGLIDDALIGNVTNLMPTLVKHHVQKTGLAIEKAKAALEAEQIKFGIASNEGEQARQAVQAGAAITDGHDVPTQAGTTEEEDDWILMETSQQPIRVLPAAADESALEAIEDEIHEFVLTEPTALSDARDKLKKAEKSHKLAKRLEAMNGAIRDLLVTNPNRENDERIGSALNTIISSLSGSNYARTTAFAGNALSAGEGLPAQNIIGTYVAIYGWKSLEALIGQAVERHLENLRTTSLARRQEAILNNEPPEDEELSWASQAIPKLATTLAVQHLKLYIGEDGGKFAHPKDPAYKAFADLLHANRDALARGKVSITSIVRNSASILMGLTANQVATTAQQAGLHAVNQAQQLTSTVASYTAHVGITVGATILTAGQQIAECGLVNAIAAGTFNATATAGGYAKETLSNFAGAAAGWMSGMIWSSPDSKHTYA